MTEFKIGDVVMYTPVKPSTSSVWRKRERRCYLVISTDVEAFGHRSHQVYEAARNDFFYADPENLTLVSAADHSPTILALITPKDDE